MKLILLLSLFYICQYSYGQTETERIQNDFQKTKEIVDGNHFKIVFSIATPLSGVNVRIDSAWVTVNGEKASGYLPYYTGNYGFSMTGNKGILFDNEMLNRTEKIKGRKVKKAIKYSFDIVGKNDIYRLEMDIQYDRTCYLYVTSNRRSPISYIGTIYKTDSQ